MIYHVLQLLLPYNEKINYISAVGKNRQFTDEVSGLQSWLGEVEVFLQAEMAAIGDIETLEAQLEQSNVSFKKQFFTKQS